MSSAERPAPGEVPYDDVRLARSHRLYPGADGDWCLAGPGDTVERLRVPAAVGDALERLLTGRIDYPQAATEAGGHEHLDIALQGFADRGLLVAGRPHGATRAGSAGVLGVGPVADRLTALLRVSGHEVTRSASTAGTDLAGGARQDVVVSCAAELPDAAWRDLDGRCGQAGVAWHRCHEEPGDWVVGPFTIPGQTASYDDTRARRLAAARLPTELAALWRHLDRTPPEPSAGPDVAAGVASVIAGLLATDVLAFLDGRPVPSAGFQVVVDPLTLTVERHPVLPLPAEVLSRSEPALSDAGQPP